MDLAPEHHPTEAQPYLPHYEVIVPLGEGAVATVYKVRTVRDGSTRALKSLKAGQAAKPLSARRFQDEFRILSRLHHPGLPDVFDYGVGREGAHYIVMELVEGDPIDRYVAENNNELWLLIYQLTEALSFVHDHRLLHLDLKPDNALIKQTRAFGDRDMPLVTLIDFGLSYQRDVGGETETVGTAHYMSPEIIRRDDKLTRAADYYSLGALLYELIEGRPPFEGSVHDILQAHLTKPVKFSQKKVDYAELYPWVERLMSKEPNERLTAFQEFRRMVATRQSEPIPGLERAYALGYIESLGMFGKRGVWDELEKWTSELQEVAVSDTHLRFDAAPAELGAEASDISLDAPLPDLTEAIRKNFLSGVPTKPDNPLPAPGVRCRYVSLVGPPGSGKSYIINAIRAEIRPRGVEFVLMNDLSQLESLFAISHRQKGRVDPSSVRLDRFVAAWERLRAMARAGGLVIAADDCGRLPEETREFIEYLIKRIELSSSDGEEVGISVVVTDESPSLKKKLTALLSDEESMRSFDIPPPGTKDIEAIVSEFHGHMPGADHRKALNAYLGRHLESDGAVMLALREAVADGDLKYEFGHWQFREPGEPRGGSSTTVDYYRKVFPELWEGSQALVRWLCCHKGRITVRQIEDLSGLDNAAVSVALENLKPYRIIDVVSENDNYHLEFVSNDVREAFYGLLSDAQRQRTHEAYVEYLEGYDDRRVSGLESLTYQYERAGMVRKALITRLRAIRKAKKERSFDVIRKLSHDGVAFVRARDVSERFWYVERFFIKTLIDVEWKTNNYGSLITHVNLYLLNHDRDIPLSFSYKYGFSLVSTADFAACESFINDRKRKLVRNRTGLYDSVLLVEAFKQYECGKIEAARGILDSMKPNLLHLGERARFYVCRVLVYQTLGDFRKREKYLHRAQKTSRKAGNSELILRINYETVIFLLNQAKHIEAKSLIRNSIRIASQRRLYRSLCTMYFLAWVLYHEEGNHTQALKYLDKAVQYASDIGMSDHVKAYLARYSMTYRSLGQYGTAIEFLKRSRKQFSREDKQYFFATTILFDIYTTIGNRGAKRCESELAELAKRWQADHVGGLYYQFLGDYRGGKGEGAAALDAYRTAADVYGAIDSDDDALRTRIAMAHTYLRLDKLEKAKRCLTDLCGAVADFESPSVRAEYSVLRLAYEMKRENSRAPELAQAVENCEKEYDRVTEMKTRVDMNAMLFRAYVALDKNAAAMQRFRSFYACIKEVSSNLSSPDDVNDYVSQPRFVELFDLFRSTKEETQASD